jgi:hypothetical protein
LRGTDERGSRAVRERLPQEKLAPSPWRSLGGYLDYTGWQDRERFRELDDAIGRWQKDELDNVELLE